VKARSLGPRRVSVSRAVRELRNARGEAVGGRGVSSRSHSSWLIVDRAFQNRWSDIYGGDPVVRIWGALRDGQVRRGECTTRAASRM
jgi:hypothetical protein